VKNELGKGCVGVFIDNVNLDMHVGNGDGGPVVPADPRTGDPMTQEDWHHYEGAILIEAG
jgi:hypothetical protein